MMIGDDAAGRTAIECLIEQGKLTPDFWFRVNENHRDHSSWDGNDTCSKEVSNMVKLAMGAEDLEVPSWARPDYKLPDYTWIRAYDQPDFPTIEPYYSTATLSETFLKCYESVSADSEDLKHTARVFSNVSLRIWRRILPHFNPKLSDEIIGIENWPERRYRGHSKRHEINYLVSGAMIRDKPFREFYDQRGIEGLGKIFHGIGRKAVLSVGAMLFLSGEHDDLIHTAEQLSDELNRS